MSVSSQPAGLPVSRGAWRVVLLLAIALSALCILPIGARAEVQEPVTAVWREHRLTFFYHGYAAVRPCPELRHRIARVLNAVGARPDVSVTLDKCDAAFASPGVDAGDRRGWPQNPTGGWTPSSSRYGTRWLPGFPESGFGAYRRSEPLQVVEVQVRLALPTEITPEVADELRADRKRRELITRVTGDPLPLFDDPIAFAAQRQVVRLSNDTAGIEIADCELLDELASSAFRRLGMRVVRRGYTCDRQSLSRIPPTLDVEALIPVDFLQSDEGEAPESNDGPGRNEFAPAAGSSRGDSEVW